MSLLGIDLGTSGVRVAAYDLAGGEIAAASAGTTLHRPAPGLAELDAEEVMAAVIRLCAEVTASAPVRADPVESLSFAVLGEAVLPVDGAGKALAPAPVSMDRRGETTAACLADVLGNRVVQEITGQPLHPMFAVHKISASAQWPVAAQYQSLGEYVAGQLGARPAVDLTMAARTGAFDVQRRQWSPDILDALGVNATTLAEVVSAGTVVGAVSTEAAAWTGVRAGTPIIAGLHDQAASFVGGGGRAATSCVVSFGSSDCLTVGTASRPIGLDGTGFASYPVRENLWVTLAGTAAGGWALTWLADLVRATGQEWEALYDVSAQAPPGLLVMPYFAGSGTLDNDPDARAAVLGLTLETSRSDLARAFLEASGFEIAKIADALARSGVPPTQAYAVGGGARSVSALQVRADAAGIPLTGVAANASTRGAAMVAGLGIGAFGTVTDVPLPPVGFRAEPRHEHTSWYAAQRATFAATYQTLRPVNQALAAL
ncbi:hypothetical protein IM660_02300 [Ruania alkalisoli]|uniref:Carbohydrate kinase n=1 Tax=Ruania alkalisoli TaxID=2779775 RepID=A0A7M1SX05_9MICO|nr:FGGY-family carbohydrate kinase [Ruania alkalisoli]QOR71163.1 hypothetical protein IM660_02300 [Ruania alkalisoli]